MSATAPPLERTAGLDAALANMNVEGHWNTNREGLPSEPLPAEPCLWRWRELQPRVLEAGALLGPDSGAARRTLRLCSPGLPGKTTTATIHASIQMVKPGEVAKAHRHTIGAFRFVIQGTGAYTTVDGERFILHDNDLVLTPHDTWHDHGNESDQPTIWLDGHDLPLVRALNVLFFEPHNSAFQEITRPSGYARRLGGAMRQRGASAAIGGMPYIYKGAEALATLRMLGPEARDPCDGLTLEYVNPFTGGPALPTITCRLHLLEPGERTRTHRHTASTIYHVVEGAGTSRVGDKTFHWEKGDLFVVPNWTWHEHAAQASSEAVLFSASDEPVMIALTHMRVQNAPHD